jgi:dolichol kinase
MEYLIGFAGGFSGMLAEIASFNIIDDNIAIPVVAGAVMWSLYSLLLPSLNIFMLN